MTFELKKTFVPSEQQASYFEWVKNGSGSCILLAVAGAGKTTTIIESLSLMSGQVFFGAYSKAICEEIKGRVHQQNVSVSTFHAAGLRFLKRAFGNTVLNSNKCRDLYRVLFMTGDAETDRLSKLLENSVLQLVALAKQSAFGVVNQGTDEEWLDLIDRYDIEVFDKEGVDKSELVLSCGKKVLQESILKDSIAIDFDDMIYSPLVHNVKIFQYDWVLIDEAQDINASRRELSRRMLKKGGRLVAVGDPRQAIFAFQGADSNSLNLIKEQFNCVEIPLTVTYRCPKAVVEYAQQWVSHITAHESAPQGVVRSVDLSQLTTMASPGDAIVCRFNAPLVENVYKFIKLGIPAKIEGREIAEGMKNLIRRWKSKNFNVLIERLTEYRDREIEKLAKKEMFDKMTSIEDKVDCMMVMIERVRTIDPYTTNPVERIVQEIDSIFGKKEDMIDCVRLMSIHRSKGREFGRVIWLQTGMSKQATKDWQVEQEYNLMYVAATRAKKELLLIDMLKAPKAMNQKQFTNFLDNMSGSETGVKFSDINEYGQEVGQSIF